MSSEFYSNKKVKRYAVSPGGKALYNDSTRFGTKMLEKMGWTKGKGLGANLDGNLNFVRVSHKDDSKGVGFHDRDDQWTQHEQNFNALLKSFEVVDGSHGDTDPAEEANNDEPQTCQGFGFQSAKKANPEMLTKETVFSGVSLEAQSKKSTKRVHYKKFTRGKDMARYSEQDLANIFGKKQLNEQHAFVAAEPIVANELEDDEQKEKSNEKVEEHVFGVTVIKSGTSINDYFKAKMEALRLKRKGPNNEAGSNPFYVYNPEKVTLNFSTNTDEAVTTANADEEDAVVPKKVKKSKKAKVELESEVTSTVEETPIVDDAVLDITRKKKKKSRKSKHGDVDAEPAAETSTDKIDFVISKAVNTPNHPEDAENVEIPDMNSPEKKSKKKKRKDMELTDSAVLDAAEPENVPAKPKKAKKHKTLIADDENSTTLGVDAPHKKKKKSKSEVIAIVPTQPLHFPRFISNVLTSLYDPNVADSCDQLDTVVQSASNTANSNSINNTTTTLSDTFELIKSKAEVFRFFDLDGYSGSTLADVPGYGYDRNLQLKVVTCFRDEQRIMNFWDQALMNKYGVDAATSVQAKKTMKKKKYNVRRLENKNVFKF